MTALPKKIKKKSTTKFKSELDAVFSQWIRLSDADEHGYCTCFTCGVRKPWRQMQNGHYVSRVFLATRFMRENCEVQCPGCNVFRHGNYTRYALLMMEKYGRNHLGFLDRESRKIVKDYPYQEKIDHYKSLVDGMLS